MSKKPVSQSQVMELFLMVAEELGFESDAEIAALAGAGPESVANWRSGAVKEFKAQKFRAGLDNLRGQLRALSAQAGLHRGGDLAMSSLEIEDGSSPTDLQRQFRDRVGYDYLGQRFLYFEPQGALAWEKLIKVGYEQDYWLQGVHECAQQWLATTRDSEGNVRGPIAHALGLARRERVKGLDVVSLGPGEGGKEIRVLEEIIGALDHARGRSHFLCYLPVDVSIALLLHAARSARQLFAERRQQISRAQASVLPICADFEEGTLAFVSRMRTSSTEADEAMRLVLLLGNVLGNLRDEETFVRQKLSKIVRPKDMIWVEVGLRSESVEDDPLFVLTQADREETAAEANRRLLLEGPYRRWSVASGRGDVKLDLRVRVREGDESARVPGSYNFCHDLLLRDERRSVTMLYSRRYQFDELSAWFERLGYSVEGLQKARDSQGRQRVGHLLLQRQS